jgi:bifunctional DNase/RNase
LQVCHTVKHNQEHMRWCWPKQVENEDYQSLLEDLKHRQLQLSWKKWCRHDLFKTFALTFDIEVKEIIIYNLVEGIFFSKIVCEQNGQIHEIDARTSDAIAIGVRFNAPVFTLENILASAGILLDEDTLESISEDPMEQEAAPGNAFSSLSLEELETKLNEAIANEEYEVASKIRDEINKRTSN